MGGNGSCVSDANITSVIHPSGKKNCDSEVDLDDFFLIQLSSLEKKGMKFFFYFPNAWMIFFDNDIMCMTIVPYEKKKVFNSIAVK